MSMCWYAWEFCFEGMKKRWKVRHYRNKGQVGFFQGQSDFSQREGMQEKGKRNRDFRGPKDKNLSRAKRGISCHFCLDISACVQRDRGSELKQWGLRPTEHQVRGGLTWDICSGFVQVVFYKWLAGSRLFREVQSSETMSRCVLENITDPIKP